MGIHWNPIYSDSEYRQVSNTSIFGGLVQKCVASQHKSLAISRTWNWPESEIRNSNCSDPEYRLTLNNDPILSRFIRLCPIHRRSFAGGCVFCSLRRHGTWSIVQATIYFFATFGFSFYSLVYLSVTPTIPFHRFPLFRSFPPPSTLYIYMYYFTLPARRGSG